MLNEMESDYLCLPMTEDKLTGAVCEFVNCFGELPTYMYARSEVFQSLKDFIEYTPYNTTSTRSVSGLLLAGSVRGIRILLNKDSICSSTKAFSFGLLNSKSKNALLFKNIKRV